MGLDQDLGQELELLLMLLVLLLPMLTTYKLSSKQLHFDVYASSGYHQQLQ